MKRIILKEEEEIINKADRGVPFANLGEVETYLKHVLDNKDFYIKEHIRIEFDGEDITWITGGIIAVCLLIFGGSFLLVKLLPLIPMLSGLKIPTLFGALKIAGISIPTAFGFYGLENFFARRTAKKIVNQEIKALKAKCGYAKDNDKVLEEIRQISEKYKTPAKEADEFINMIQKDIISIANIKYPGFEQDIQDLYDLAKRFLEAKRALKVTSENYVLASSSDWFKQLNEIEGRINENTKIKVDQQINMQVLDQISQVLAQENIQLNEITSKTTPKSDSQELKLTL